MNNSTATKRAPQCSACGCDSQGNLRRRLWVAAIALLLIMTLAHLISSHETPNPSAAVSYKARLPEKGK
jgi:hypothetical protein